MGSDLLTPVITKKPRVNGIIKQKPDDFIVGEISKNLEILDPRAEDFKLEGRKGLFIHFVLIKYNTDTTTALDWISKIWNVPRNNIGIAGSKDKRALTAQKVSVWGLKEKFEEGKIQKINTPTIKTESLCLRLKELRLGDLWGNYFEITVRNIAMNQTEIEKKLKEKLKEIENNKSILNGFGIQRFGEIRPITHIVGEKLLLGDFKSAIKEYIGRTFGKESEDEANARKLFWDTENSEETLKVLPNHLHIERNLLKELLRTRNNYEQVFFTLPLQLRKLFVHAYQSYLFNKYITIRYNEYSNDLQSPISGEKLVNDEVMVPVIGSKIELSGETKEIYQHILSQEIFSLDYFYKPLSKKLGGTGTFRSIKMNAKDLQVLDVSADEINENKNKAIISFQLRKGSYATELLREIIRD